MEKSEEILTVENLTKSFGPVKVLDKGVRTFFWTYLM